MNLATLERQFAERADLAAIPDMSPTERATKLAETSAVVERLEEELTQTMENAKQLFDERQEKQREKGFDYPGWRQDMRVELEATEACGRLGKEYRAAQRSLERLEKAIAKAEQAEQADSLIPANADCTAQPTIQHVDNKQKKRGKQ